MTTVQQLIDFLTTLADPDAEVIVMSRLKSVSRVEGDVATWTDLDLGRIEMEPARPGITREMEKGDAPGVTHYLVPPLTGRIYLGMDL